MHETRDWTGGHCLNADEILSVARDWINEESKHGNYPQFARGFVNFKVGGNGYSADVVVGISNDGSATLYDLVNIADKKITEALNTPVGNNASRRGSTSVQGDNNTAQAQSQGANNNPSATAVGLSMMCYKKLIKRLRRKE